MMIPLMDVFSLNAQHDCHTALIFFLRDTKVPPQTQAEVAHRFVDEERKTRPQ